MHEEVEILIAEDDEGHAGLIRKNLARAGISNPIRWLRDGREALDFLLGEGAGPHLEHSMAYLLLLDLRMPRADGIEVLRRIKADPRTRRIPVIMITTTDDPREVEACHDLGCSNYITKPVDYQGFVEAIRQLGLFLSVVQVPAVDGER